MANTVDTPVQNSPKGPSLVTKVYPGSSKIGKGHTGNGGTIQGPATNK